jgi:hypothetical protein
MLVAHRLARQLMIVSNFRTLAKSPLDHIGDATEKCELSLECNLSENKQDPTVGEQQGIDCTPKSRNHK